jgi:hypothetical protein
MPPRVNPQLSLAAVRCLQRVSEAAPDAVSGAAALELATAASKLFEYTAKTCAVGRANQAVMIPTGTCGWQDFLSDSPGSGYVAGCSC